MIWLAIAGGFLVSFIFSGIEAGILSMNRVRLKHRRKLRDPAALTLDRLLKRPERVLVTALIVTNFMNICVISLAAGELVRVFGRWGYAMALIVFLPLYVLGLELLPKSLFRRFPYRALAALSGPLRIADLLLSPLHAAGSAVTRLFLGKRPPKQQKLFVGREDFRYLTIESEKTGTLGKEERQMIHNVLDFRTVKATDVMVPMPQVRTISAQAAIEDLIARSRAENIDRWPIVSETGRIIGLAHIFDVALDGRRRGIVESYQRRIVIVSANEPAFSVLRKLRAARITMAVVRDGDGQQLGVVAWEDLMRRLVTTTAAA